MNTTLDAFRPSRREILARMGSGLAAIVVSTACGDMTPREARARRIELQVLSAEEARTLESLGDTLLPGAADAGIAHFIDDQLQRDDPMLLLKYLDTNASFVEFYRDGLASLNRFSSERFGRPFGEIAEERRTELVGEVATANPASWTGPPAPLFYFALRSDAVDVYYGTPEGMAELRIPYLAHIEPPERW